MLLFGNYVINVATIKNISWLQKVKTIFRK